MNTCKLHFASFYFKHALSYLFRTLYKEKIFLVIFISNSLLSFFRLESQMQIVEERRRATEARLGPKVPTSIASVMGSVQGESTVKHGIPNGSSHWPHENKRPLSTFWWDNSGWPQQKALIQNFDETTRIWQNSFGFYHLHGQAPLLRLLGGLPKTTDQSTWPFSSSATQLGGTEAAAAYRSPHATNQMCH